MKVKVDSFLRAESINNATSATPAEGIIKGFKVVDADDLGFKSDSDRNELTVLVDGEEYQWLPNKTSLRAIIAAYGDESNDWAEKPIKLYAVDQNVSGQMKKVVYGRV